MPQQVDTDQEKLKQTFCEIHGPEALTPAWTGLLARSPTFFEASTELAAVSNRKRHLFPKTQAFISLAIAAASTHLHAPSIKLHTERALKAGATPDEILEVIELTSTLGIHACNIGVPLLVEVLKERGQYEETIFDAKQEHLKADFTRKRGYWHPFWEDFLRLDPEFFEAYLNFSTVPWSEKEGGREDGKGILEPKIKELIYCSFDAASTHLYQPGLKLHMRNALDYGATKEEIMEVLEIASLLSLATVEAAVPVLDGQLDRRTGSL